MQMENLIAIDGSVLSCGVAWFVGGTLKSSARVVRKPEHARMGERACSMAREVLDWLADPIRGHLKRPDCVVFEWPRAYGDQVDPNALIGLAAVGASVAVTLSTIRAGVNDQAMEILAPEPREWIGQIPKTKTRGRPRKDAIVTGRMSPRARFIGSKLSDEELEIYPLNCHDQVDAIGLGLWALGRLKPSIAYAVQ